MEPANEMDLLESDDDIEELVIMEINDYGIPRHIYERSNYFNSLDELSFFRRYRLKKLPVLNLLTEIEHILEIPYDMNQSVSPMNQLLITLRYYATGNHLLSIADFAGVHTSTVCRIIPRVSHAIASLYRNYVTFPQTQDEINKTQLGFFQIAGFPRVIGAIDCTHVRIISPGGNDAEIFKNRKQYFSINVQAICNSKLKIMNVVARWGGATHDATIFNNCNVRAEFEMNRYPNCILLGDSGYNLRTFLLTPVLNPMTEQEQLYNQAHIRTRNVVERLFGVWKRRFPVLAYGCRLKLDTLFSIIIATAVLHNITLQRDEEEPPLEDAVDPNILQVLIDNGQIQVPNIVMHNNQGGAAAGINIRNEFIENYFRQL